MKNILARPMLTNHASGFFMPFPSLNTLAGERSGFFPCRTLSGRDLNAGELTQMGGGSPVLFVWTARRAYQKLEASIQVYHPFFSNQVHVCNKSLQP